MVYHKEEVISMRTVAVVDVGNLFSAAWAVGNANTPFLRSLVDPNPDGLNEVLDGLVANGSRLIRSVWFDAADHVPNTPFHLAIEQASRCDLKLGVVRNNKQSRTDAMIIQCMATLAHNHACDEIVLLSGDADLLAGIMIAKDFGIQTTVCGVSPLAKHVARELASEADRCTEIPEASIEKFMTNRTQPEPVSDTDPMYMSIVERVFGMGTRDEIQEMAATGQVPRRLDRELILALSHAQGMKMVPNDAKIMARRMMEARVRLSNGASHEQQL